MAIASSTVQVTLNLPAKMYDRVAKTAASEQRLTEEMLYQLIADGLEVHLPLRQQWERLAKRYRTRLKRQRRFDQTPEVVIQELNQLRQQIADEYYFCEYAARFC